MLRSPRSLKTLVHIYLLCSFATALQVSCKVLYSPKSELESLYIEQFKLVYLNKLFAKGFSNSSAIQQVLESDHSGFSERLISDSDVRFIDSLTTIENEKMKVDSIKGESRAEGAKGKRPLQFILKTIESKSLDRLARERLKISGIPDDMLY